MKKLLICLLLVCFIATNFAACTKQGSVGDINTEIDTSENTHTSPPLVLRFDSVGEVIELKGMLNKSEENLTEYLSNKSFNMNGLNSKEDIEDLFEKIGDLKILHLKENSGYKLEFIDYNITYGTLDMGYTSDNGYIRFERYLSDSKMLKHAEDTAVKENSIVKTAKEKFTVLNKSLVFEVMDNTESLYRIVSVFNSFDAKTRILLADNAKKGFDLAAIEQNIVETTLNELMQQKQVK